MTDVNTTIVYYSATGSTYLMAKAAAESAEKAGSQVRLRKVHELAPEEAIASNAGWTSPGPGSPSTSRWPPQTTDSARDVHQQRRER